MEEWLEEARAAVALRAKSEGQDLHVVYIDRGFRCRISTVAHEGYLCGYAGVTKEHPFADVDGSLLPISVHGGVTWAEWNTEGIFEIGFDCGHSTDHIIRLPTQFDRCGLVEASRRNVVPKDHEFVKNEIKLMVDQIDMVEYAQIKYKKAGKLAASGRSLFYKNKDRCGIICDIEGEHSLTHHIVHEYSMYCSQTPAQIMASKWYLLKEES